ncbi:hypothetical protein CEQ90_20270 [Lewinellaceae bacterium SD302]|nr:hypothetical protein CEQ90_20270 [Lewinellaceae bacterium SD302]
MMTNKILLLVVSLYLPSLGAQSIWTNYSVSDGLLSLSVQTIEKDINGNLWVGFGSGSTGDGIGRFNGYNWEYYNTSNSEISSNAIRQIQSDSNGNIWICYYGGFTNSIQNLTKFDGQEWEVFDETNSGILSDLVSEIQIDEYNNIWTSSRNGFSKYSSNVFTNYELNISPNDFVVVDSSYIWFAYTSPYGNGIGKYDLLNQAIIDTFNQNNSTLSGYSITCLDQDSQGRLWVGFNFGFQGGFGSGGSNGGLALFDNGNIIPIMPLNNNQTGVYDLEIDLNDNVWISTRCEGLYKYDGVSWSKILNLPMLGCSAEIEIDKNNEVWYSESLTGIWTNSNVISSRRLLNKKVDDEIVYPNPAISSIFIKNIKSGDKCFQMYNANGIKVIEHRLPQNKLNANIPISDLNNGVYLWCIVNRNGKSKQGRIIIL